MSHTDIHMPQTWHSVSLRWSELAGRGRCEAQCINVPVLASITLSLSIPGFQQHHLSARPNFISQPQSQLRPPFPTPSSLPPKKTVKPLGSLLCSAFSIDLLIAVPTSWPSPPLSVPPLPFLPLPTLPDRPHTFLNLSSPSYLSRVIRPLPVPPLSTSYVLTPFYPSHPFLPFPFLILPTSFHRFLHLHTHPTPSCPSTPLPTLPHPFLHLPFLPLLNPFYPSLTPVSYTHLTLPTTGDV